METVGFSTTCQGTQEESQTSMCQITDLSPTCDPAIAHESALSPVSHGPGDPEERCLRRLLPEKRAFIEVQVSRELLAHICSKKMCMCMHTHKVRGTIWLCLHHLSPKQHSSVPRNHLLSPWFLQQGESEGMWVSTWLLRLYRNLANMLISLLSRSGYWVVSCVTGAGRSKQDYWRALKEHGFCYLYHKF